MAFTKNSEVGKERVSANSEMLLFSCYCGTWNLNIQKLKDFSLRPAHELRMERVSLSTPANTVDRPVTCLNTASAWLRATTPSGCSRPYHPLKLQLKLNLRAACVCDEPASDLCSSSCRFDLSLTANTLLYQTKHILVPSGNHNNAENTQPLSRFVIDTHQMKFRSTAKSIQYLCVQSTACTICRAKAGVRLCSS